jgi:hypothetical protein
MIEFGVCDLLYDVDQDGLSYLLVFYLNKAYLLVFYSILYLV